MKTCANKHQREITYIAIGLTLLAVIPALSSCTTKPHMLLILAEKPMSQTFVPAYPSIETVYETDDEIKIVTYWARVGESMNHTFQWEILDESGVAVFKDSDHNMPIRTHIFYTKTINLSRASLSSGSYTVRFYQDGKLCMTRMVTYSPQDALNQNVRKVVVLPFADLSKSTNMARSASVNVVNTVSHAIYCQAKRHFQEAVPHHVAKREIGEPLPQGCLGQEACRRNLEKIFGNCIFISGNVTLKRQVEETASLEVEAYNAITGELREYTSSVIQHGSYNGILHDLMKRVMVDKGLLQDLRSM